MRTPSRKSNALTITLPDLTLMKANILLLHPFNGLFCRTTWVSQYQNGKTSLDLNKARNYGVLGCSGISWTICKQFTVKSAPRSRQITIPTPHHSILQARCSAWRQTNSVKALKMKANIPAILFNRVILWNDIGVHWLVEWTGCYLQEFWLHGGGDGNRTSSMAQVWGRCCHLQDCHRTPTRLPTARHCVWHVATFSGLVLQVIGGWTTVGRCTAAT